MPSSLSLSPRKVQASSCGPALSSMFLLCILLTFLASLAIFVLRHSNPTKSSKRVEGLPAGSMGWPLVGETLEFLEPHLATSRGKFMERHIVRYGNVFKSSLFGHPTIISADPDLNRFILLNEDKLFQCSYPSVISDILGKWSMLVLAGDAHKAMRAIAQNFMSSHKLKHCFLGDIERHVLLTLQSWEDNCVFPAQEEAKKFTFNLMAKQILSFDPGEPKTIQLRKDYYTFMNGAIGARLNFPGTAYRKAMQSRAKILETLKITMEKRMHQPPKQDLLGAVISEGYLSTEQVLDLVLNMLFAGHETSSIALTLAINFLAESSEVKDELKKEHETIQETQKSRNLSWDDYKKMSFTQCVIDETLRLGNVVRFVHRKALQDIVFKDISIPEGWKVLPVFCAVHLDPTIYENPLKFDPWRWQGRKSNVYFTPFGGGSRLCAGADLAKMEMAIFLHHLVLKYDWKLSEPDRALAFPFVKFEKGLPIRITKRSPLSVSTT